MIIDIIGAGIGGLTTAIALEQKGIKVRVFEQAKAIKSVGAGIILANNAMQVYDKLGLRKEIEQNGNHISSMNITRPNLYPISKVDLSFFEKKYNVRNIAIHRGNLQQILVQKLKSTSLNLNHHLAKIDITPNGYLLNFSNSKQIPSSIVIGADGINSIVRQSVFSNSKIRYAKQICWRGVTQFELPSKYKNELNEAWGKKDRFGFVQLDKRKVYWYALKSFKKNINEFPLNNIEKYFNDYDPLIKNIISSTPKEQINTAEISDLKPLSTWYKKNVCLIGDAAHAMTPNMGQGACQAIEDAYTLSHYLVKHTPIKAFEAFQKARIAKAQKVVNTSWMIGKIAHLSNPFLVELRNQLMRLTPTSINRKQSEQIFQISNL